MTAKVEKMPLSAMVQMFCRALDKRPSLRGDFKQGYLMRHEAGRAEKAFRQSAELLLAHQSAQLRTGRRKQEIFEFWQDIAALAQLELNAAVREHLDKVG
jgi:hypothetical protein